MRETDLTELNKLEALLKDARIPYTKEQAIIPAKVYVDALIRPKRTIYREVNRLYIPNNQECLVKAYDHGDGGLDCFAYDNCYQGKISANQVFELCKTIYYKEVFSTSLEVTGRLSTSTQARSARF